MENAGAATTATSHNRNHNLNRNRNPSHNRNRNRNRNRNQPLSEPQPQPEQETSPSFGKIIDTLNENAQDEDGKVVAKPAEPMKIKFPSSPSSKKSQTVSRKKPVKKSSKSVALQKKLELIVDKQGKICKKLFIRIKQKNVAIKNKEMSFSPEKT